MGFIFHAQRIINDYENAEKAEIKQSLKQSPKLLPQIKEIEEIKEIKGSPRMKKRVKSMDNFMKYQWSWTL